MPIGVTHNLKKHLLAACSSAMSVLSLSVPVEATPVLSEDCAAGRALNLPVYRWHDPSAPHKGNIVAVHGLTFCARSFDELGRFLAQEGYDFYAIDMRGFGKWKATDKPYAGDNLIHFDATRKDIVLLLSYLRESQPHCKQFGLGESLGSNVILRVASEQPELLDGLILGSLGYKMRMKIRPRTLLDVPKCAVWRNKAWDWTAYIKNSLTEDRKLLARLLEDDQLNRKLSIADLIKSALENKRAIAAASKLPQMYPLLMIAGENDRMFKTKSLPILLSKIGAKNVKLAILPKRGHLLLEHQEVSPRIASLLTGWLEKHNDSASGVASTPAAESPGTTSGIAPANSGKI